MSARQTCPSCGEEVVWDEEHSPHGWRHAHDSRWCESVDGAPPVYPEGATDPTRGRLPALTAGDLVTVQDPTYGPRRGRVREAWEDGSVYIEGPRIDDVRVFAWTIDADKVAEYVTRVPART